MRVTIESKFYNFLDIIYKIMKLSIFFILSSLGIVTLFSSLTSVAYITRKWIDNGKIEIFKNYKKLFRENIRESVVLTLIFFLLFIILEIGKKLSFIYGILEIYFLMYFFIIAYIKANYEMKIKNIFSFAFKFLNLNIWIIVPFLGVLYLIYVIFVFNIFLFIVFGIGLGLIFLNILIYYTLKKYNK
ncbi:uncharacterized protein DUF624 [Hypnocyclicus thermotrophus]|uniref:Uncharacterized protein DUF624 n=1 Tax=Hypnocyclicus thermotrophus TaxID=1627895 RepID=A0AA46DYM3_9FUSO|nr:DUF624 domain-containing protein [Hypnocyclicus thermotrophus]TDT70452.1 uncharacterized protein DUF624 [Hypnocyclicus thermotrophus]